MFIDINLTTETNMLRSNTTNVGRKAHMLIEKLIRAYV
jgi:hypothetical protein